MTPLGLGWAMSVEARRPRWAVLWGVAALFVTGCATLPPPSGEGDAYGSAEVSREGRAPEGPLSCGGQAVPEDWPDYSSWWDEELLAPFFQCTSPGEFLALQRRVDMPRLVEALEDWSAVRLGALGPMEAGAARVLQRKRLSFLVTATRKYGAYAQVLILFLVDTAFDDEVRELLLLLARDKQQEQTLGQMEAVREALQRRGFKLSDYPDRDEQLGDVVRGLGRAAADVASTIPAVDGVRGGDVFAVRAHLPPPYQEAFDETERALTREHWAQGHVVLGAFDSLTFGVPLGFFYLAEGTGHGGISLYQGRYEQAARELAPAALMVGLYAGAKGGRHLSEANAAGWGGVRRLQVPALDAEGLKAVAERLGQRLGSNALRDLTQYLQAQREAGLLIAEWGEAGAAALHEARGDVPRARQVILAVANSQRPGLPPTRVRAAPDGAKVDAKDIKGARPYGPDGRPGHPDAHGVSRQDQADILNDPKTTVHRGVNANGRPVDHYHRDGTTVITEQGEPTRVITAFGKLATKDSKGRPIQRGTGKPANPVPNGGPHEKLR